MTPSSRRKAARLGRQASELMLAAPQVVTHRLRHLALAGPRPALRDRLEFQRMGAEKIAAFGEAWQAMGLQALKSQQQLAAALLRGTLPAPSRRRAAHAATLGQAAAAWQQAWLDILDQGLQPVHRRAVANAKRLGRKP